jgi:hypothetical protein
MVLSALKNARRDIVNRNILLGLALCTGVALVIIACDNSPAVPLPPPPAQAPPPMMPQGMPGMPGMQGMPGMPGMQPGVPTPPTPPVAPVAEPPLPRTELIPISDVVPEPDKIVKVKKEVCNLPGPASPGDELVGNYQCNLKLDKPILGLQPPAFGCAIKPGSEGKFFVTNTSRDVTLKGPITETKAAGFRVQGTFKYTALELAIGSCMKTKGVGKYKGSCNAVLNQDKKNKLKCTLEMTRQ